MRKILRMRKEPPEPLLSIYIHFVVFRDSVSGQRKPWSDLRCLHMPEDTLLQGSAHIKIFSMYMFKALLACSSVDSLSCRIIKGNRNPFRGQNSVKIILHPFWNGFFSFSVWASISFERKMEAILSFYSNFLFSTGSMYSKANRKSPMTVEDLLSVTGPLTHLRRVASSTKTLWTV